MTGNKRAAPDAEYQNAPDPELAAPIVEGAEDEMWFNKLSIKFPTVRWPSYAHLEWYEHPAFKISVLISCMAIIFGIYFGALEPIRVDRDRFTSATCVSLNLTRLDTRCCDVNKCVCQQCVSTSPLCSQLIPQSLNVSTCCGESCCAEECWDTCYDQVCKTDDKGNRVCHTESRRCNRHCCTGKLVVRRTCAFQCGTCSAYAIRFRVSGIGHPSLSYARSCGRDQAVCRLQVESAFAMGQTWPCWYHADDPSRVRFDGVPKWDVAAWVFLGLFSAIWLGCILYWWGYPAAHAAWIAASR